MLQSQACVYSELPKNKHYPSNFCIKVTQILCVPKKWPSDVLLILCHLFWFCYVNKSYLGWFHPAFFNNLKATYNVKNYKGNQTVVQGKPPNTGMPAQSLLKLPGVH